MRDKLSRFLCSKSPSCDNLHDGDQKVQVQLCLLRHLCHSKLVSHLHCLAMGPHLLIAHVHQLFPERRLQGEGKCCV